MFDDLTSLEPTNVGDCRSKVLNTSLQAIQIWSRETSLVFHEGAVEEVFQCAKIATIESFLYDFG